jgi:hypothetical protein
VSVTVNRYTGFSDESLIKQHISNALPVLINSRRYKKICYSLKNIESEISGHIEN